MLLVLSLTAAIAAVLPVPRSPPASSVPYSLGFVVLSSCCGGCLDCRRTLQCILSWHLRTLSWLICAYCGILPVGTDLLQDGGWVYPMAEGEPEFLTVGQARALLGVSKRAITRLIEDGTLASEPNPFDKRSKLVRRADVLALKTKMPPKMPPKKAAA
jgi:hypothetical protein